MASCVTIDDGCVVRHCKRRLVHGKKVSAEAFRLRCERESNGQWYPEDTYLSVCWLEFHGGNLDLIRRDIPLKTKRGEHLLVLNIADIVTIQVPSTKGVLSVKHKPRDGRTDDSHAGICGYRPADNATVGGVLRHRVDRIEPAVP
ncbi:MAG: hypothetical protein OXG65_02355 [Chloroflexi bacterium]|nr:hypothetical protein [Chloroflexota bacterium]